MSAFPKRVIRSGYWKENVHVLSGSRLGEIVVTDRGEGARMISRLGPLPTAPPTAGPRRE